MSTGDLIYGQARDEAFNDMCEVLCKVIESPKLRLEIAKAMFDTFGGYEENRIAWLERLGIVKKEILKSISIEKTKVKLHVWNSKRKISVGARKH